LQLEIRSNSSKTSARGLQQFAAGSSRLQQMHRLAANKIEASHADEDVVEVENTCVWPAAAVGDL
jgi:hypothetical protein